MRKQPWTPRSTPHRSKTVTCHKKRKSPQSHRTVPHDLGHLTHIHDCSLLKYFTQFSMILFRDFGVSSRSGLHARGLRLSMCPAVHAMPPFIKSVRGHYHKHTELGFSLVKSMIKTVVIKSHPCIFGPSHNRIIVV